MRKWVHDRTFLFCKKIFNQSNRKIFWFCMWQPRNVKWNPFISRSRLILRWITIFQCSSKSTGTSISYLECTQNYVLTGAGISHVYRYYWRSKTQNAWIAVLDKNSLEIVKKWCTQKPGFDWCYHERLEIIFSAHVGGEIIAWDLKGIQRL